jgi:anti-sigma factor RsiW
MSQQPDKFEPIAGSQPLEEQFVAYLDGELNDEESARVERLVSADPKARDSLHRLEQTWSALDELDRANHDHVLTRTTLEMVALEAEHEVERLRDDVPRKRRLRWVLGSGGLVAAAAAGLIAVAMGRPDPNRQLLHDLPVIEKLDELRQIDDVEFLKLLNDEGLFVKEPADET